MKSAGRILLILVIFGTAVFFQAQISPIKPKKEFLRPPEKIKYFTFGYNDMMASVLWLRLVQNFDYCEGGKFTEADYVTPTKPTGKERLTGILERKLGPSKCHLGWVYSMLEVISEIQPRFQLVYDTGATFLSVAVDDREGARRIFEKGILVYPNDWQLLFRAAYHYVWEIQNPGRAAELYLRAGNNGAPQWVVSFAGALYTRVGQAHIAKIILEDAIKKNPDGRFSPRIKERLDEVNQILKENK